jgi:hypothetical protein
MTRQALVQKPKKGNFSFFRGFFFFFLFLIDLITYELPFTPFFWHILLFYMVFYMTRISWVICGFLVGISLDVLSPIQIGFHLGLVYLFLIGAVCLRITLKNHQFSFIWGSFILLELCYFFASTFLTMGVFFQPFSSDLFFKSTLTVCFFPLALYAILWQEA